MPYTETVLSARTQPVESVERFFQFSLLGLITSAYFALAGSGSLDRPTLALTFIGLLIRAAMVSGLLRVGIPANVVSLAALGYIVFFPIDLYFLSRDFLATTVHGVCFLATVKILTAQSNRDYAWTGVISFVELIAAAMLSAQSSFFAYLALYMVFVIAAFTSAEIRRRLQRNEQQVVASLARSVSVGVPGGGRRHGNLRHPRVITLGLFLIVPRTARMIARVLPLYAAPYWVFQRRRSRRLRKNQPGQPARAARPLVVTGVAAGSEMARRGLEPLRRQTLVGTAASKPLHTHG